MHPAGLEALFRTTATAGLTGLLCWVVCALVARAISRSALMPYVALTDHFERLADGPVERPLDLRRSPPAIRRLARAILVFHQRDTASRRSEATLQARYDALCQEHADERRLLMGMLMSGRLDAGDRSADLRATKPAASVAPEAPRSTVREAVGGTAPASLRIVDLKGRLQTPARAVDVQRTIEPIDPDALSLDFAFVRR